MEWSGLRQRPQVIADHLNRFAPLYFVNPVPLRPFRWSDTRRVVDKARSLFSAKSKPAPKHGVNVINPLYLPFRRMGLVNGYLLRRVVKGLRKALEAAGRPRPLLWIGSPSPLALAAVDRLPASRIVYDCMDDFPSFHEDSQGIERAQENIIERADIVFTVSKTLLERLRPKTRRIVMAPNGVDLSIFSFGGKSLPRPSDLPRGEITVGYHGLIGTWFDMELIAEMARARPAWRFALIGPVHRPEGRPGFPPMFLSWGHGRKRSCPPISLTSTWASFPSTTAGCRSIPIPSRCMNTSPWARR